MNKNSLILSISIIFGCIVLGGFFYAAQINKQKSIEKQQLIEAETKVEQTKKEEDKQLFDNTLKCNSLLTSLQQRWNNVVGIYYDSFLNTCIVKYTEKGETKESPLETMQNI
ncbi:MAG: hypothetical protein JWN37_867 [Candidatus Nomurabacteria bacterium]|nr:hypothetical protein [Candidatus Nomurabacteria bacterium]